MNAGEEATRVDRAATLIVTRPEPEAGKLVDALIARGRRAWALPVLAIEKLDDASDDEATLRQAIARIDGYALVVFVSPNAIRHALAMREAAWPRNVIIGVMGPGSVETLRTMGIASPALRVLSPRDAPGDEVASEGVDGAERFDSEGLFAALDDAMGLTKAFGGRVLIVRGNGGRAWFADRLRELGIAVDEVVAYRRVRPAANREQARALRDAFAPAVKPAFIVTSSEGVANLVAIVHEALGDVMTAESIDDCLFASTIVAPHRRIAARARDAGFSRIVVTPSGDRGILAAIE